MSERHVPAVYVSRPKQVNSLTMTRFVPRVDLICQFGKPVRGISPYADGLLSGLHSLPDVQVNPVDYQAAFPGGLHPGGPMTVKPDGELHWAKPVTWRRAALSDADILHFQHWLAPMAAYLWPVARTARRHGKAVLVTVHNPRSHEAMAWAEPFERRLFANADALLVHDERGKQALESRLKGLSVPVYVIPHGIRSTPLTDSRSADCDLLKLDPDRRYISLFGNLRQYKGVDVLLKAWARVLERVPDTDLVVAGRLWEGRKGFAAHMSARLLGSGEEARRLREAMANPALAGRAHFWQGFLDDAVIDALLRISELSVFPYIRFSSQSGAACRAAGMGCPLLVSDVGGLPDLAMGPDWIVTPGDVEGLAERLLTHLQSGQGSELRQAQCLRVRDYAWENVASQHLAIYQTLCQRQCDGT